MLRLALLFLVVALVAALFGFGRVLEATHGVAQVFFYVFLVLAVALFAANLFRKETPRDLV